LHIKKDSLLNTFQNNFDDDKYNDDDSTSTTDSDHLELLKIIKRQKKEKQLKTLHENNERTSTNVIIKENVQHQSKNYISPLKTEFNFALSDENSSSIVNIDEEV
jgi:site-specific DNA-adenine methylase